MGLIQRDALLNKLNDIRETYRVAKNFNAISAIDNVIGEVKDAPSVDVAPIRHGEWIFEAPNAIGFFPVKCSKCGIKIATTGDPCDWVNEPDHLYCGSCGAKMDGKETI